MRTDLLEGYWSCITARHLALIGDVNAGCAPAFLWNGKERAMSTRRRFKQLLSLNERLEQEAARLRAQAEQLPYGPER